MDAGRGRLPPFRLAGAEAMARRAEALGAIGKALLFGDLAAVRAGAGAMAQAGASCRANLAADSTCADKLPSDSDRPPIVVPPTVLVQRPPEAWGEGR